MRCRRARSRFGSGKLALKDRVAGLNHASHHPCVSKCGHLVSGMDVARGSFEETSPRVCSGLVTDMLYQVTATFENKRGPAF